MQLRTKIILLVTTIALLVSAVFLVFLFYFVKPSFKIEAVGDIKTISETNKSTYEAFVEGLKSRARNWSSDRYVKGLGEKILTSDPSSKAYPNSIEEFRRYFVEEKMLNDPSVIIVDLLDKDGIIVASSRGERVGVNEYEEELEYKARHFSKTITAGFGEVYLMGAVFEEDEDDRPMFHATTRLFSTRIDDQGHFVPLDGVLLIHFVSTKELSSILSKAVSAQGSAESSMETYSGVSMVKDIETYLVNANGLVVASTGMFNGIEKSPLVKRCFTQDPEESVLEYINHHGISVMGTSSCFSEDGLVLISEIPIMQIYALFNQLIVETFVVGFTVFLFVAIPLTLAGRRFVGRVEKIAKLSKKVAEGDFTVRAPETFKDEIGSIARTINIILDTANTFQEDQKIANKKLAESAEILSRDLAEHKDQEQFLEQSKRATLNLLEDTWKAKEGLEVKERRLQAILSAIPTAVFLIDRNYHIEMTNPLAEQFTGFSGKDLLGRDFRTIITTWKKQKEKLPKNECPIEKTFLTNLAQTTGLEDELSMTTEKHPLYLPVTISATPLREDIHDTAVKAVVVIRDITKDRELDQARSGFISIASHQLRTPLTTIRWYSEMLLDEDVGSLSPSQRDFLTEIHEGTQRLYKTIDLLLGISRVESGKQKAEPQNIDLTMFTQEIMKELSPQANEKKLVMGMIPPPGDPLMVWIDPLRLRQVITNLLSNAIRYNNNDGLIEVLWRIAEDGREISYSVRDNGIGIPESDRGRIFTKFFRAKNALAQAPDGSGLGLPLVKDIVETWGGQIHFETTQDKGSIFTFTIPLVSAVSYLPNTEGVA